MRPVRGVLDLEVVADNPTSLLEVHAANLRQLLRVAPEHHEQWMLPCGPKPVGECRAAREHEDQAPPNAKHDIAPASADQ